MWILKLQSNKKLNLSDKKCIKNTSTLLNYKYISIVLKYSTLIMYLVTF